MGKKLLTWHEEKICKLCHMPFQTEHGGDYCDDICRKMRWYLTQGKYGLQLTVEGLSVHPEWVGL